MIKENDNMDDETVSKEVRNLAENMLKEIEQGELAKAVSLVNDLNDLRNQTLYNEIGRLTRALHDSIRNFKLEGSIGAASEIDNATDKLSYVVQMTDESANKTMDLVDDSIPLIQELNDESTQLSKDWKRFLSRDLQPDEFRDLSKKMDAFLENAQGKCQSVQGNMSEIMLAQNYQDLTGQVIHKVASLVKDVESRLVSLIAMAGHVDTITGIQHDAAEAETNSNEPDIVAEGPQINKNDEGVVGSQDDVDDLLSSLGF